MKLTKFEEIRILLINIFDRVNMDIPINFEQILQSVYEDVEETADKEDWSDGDVVIGFRRWIESRE